MRYTTKMTIIDIDAVQLKKISCASCINNNQIRREVAADPHCSNKHHECTHMYAVKVVIFANFPKPMIICTDKDLTNNDVPIREIPCQ